MRQLQIFNRLKYLALLVFLGSAGNLSAGIPWQDVAPSNDWVQPSDLSLGTYRSVGVDMSAISQIFLSPGLDSLSPFEFPLPDGTSLEFLIWADPILPLGLASSYPDIRTFTGYCPSDPTLRLKLDIGAYGMHGLILGPEADIFLDPATDNRQDLYITYRKDQAVNSGKSCTLTQAVFFPPNGPMGPMGTLKSAQITGNYGVQSLRLAASTTAELSSRFNGSDYHILSALVSLVHRSNGIFERDVSLRFVFAEGSDLLFFKDSLQDPFSLPQLASASSLANENATALQSFNDSLYDLSICFNTLNSFHTEGLGCKASSKAKSSYGLSGVLGDPFDLGYLSHLFGHIVGANHTQNVNCSRVGSSAFEPGSGSSIMALPEQCSPSLSYSQDAYFHNHSIVEIRDFLENGPGANCGSITVLGNNNAPNLLLPGNLIHIPPSTPLKLWPLYASDADQMPLSFTWEQYNLGPAGQPGSPSASAPIIRSYPPSKSEVRRIPRMQDLIRNQQTLGEILPDYDRDLRFRLTLRDNHMLGGAVSYDQMDMRVLASALPFKINTPSEQTVFISNQFHLITWEVGKTADSLINCPSVNIYLSRDSGWTFDDTLALGAPNNGRFRWFIPYGKESTNARILIEGAGHYFFNLSEVFRIESNVFGLNDQTASKESLKVFPNPWTEGSSLRIQYFPQDKQRKGSIELVVNVLNSEGKRLFNKTMNYDLDKTHIEIEDLNLSSGVYFIHVQELGTQSQQGFHQKLIRP
jgi:hypothetical protein